MNSLERLKKEFDEFQFHPILSIGCTVGLPEEGNYYKWRATLIGPLDSPYQDGLFYLELLFPNDYPNSKPQIRFLNPIYHLNVNSCDSGLSPLGLVTPSFINWWKPSTTIREILMKLYYIFYSPNPDSPWNLKMAEEYIKNRTLFDLKVRYFTKKYADLGVELIAYKNWDFSCDENNLKSVQHSTTPVKEFKNYDNSASINVTFDDESYNKYPSIKCTLNEITKDVIQRYMNKCGLNNYDNFLFIYNGKRLDLNIPIGDHGIKGDECINIACICISGVIFA